MSMKIASLSTHRIRLPFVSPMITSHGRYDTRLLLLVRVEDANGVVGWGECSALEDTSYFRENVDHAERSIAHAGKLLTSQGQGLSAGVLSLEPAARELLEAGPMAAGVADLLRSSVAGIGPMAVAAVEMAVLDAELRSTSTSLADHLGVQVMDVPVSVVIGIPPDRSVETLCEQVAVRVEQGVRGVKLKIQPGWDVAPIAAIRKRFQRADLGIIVDANESFTGIDPRPLHE